MADVSGIQKDIIESQRIHFTLHFTKKYVKEHGGRENLRELVYDILARYANDEYFDPELRD